MRHRSGEGYKKNLLHWRFPKSTVASIILKWKKFGTTRTLTRAGCPAKLSNWWRRALSRLVTKNLMVHSSWAPWSYMQMGETYRSTNITATLHRSGLYGGVAKLNPLQWRHMKILGISKAAPKGPSDSEKQDSLVWWTSILSIKESSSAHHLQSTIPKVKCAGSSLMLWGCFSAAGTGRLVRVEEKLNGAKYRDILNENLFHSAQDLRLGRRFTFQHDNDHKHTAKATQELLRDNSVNVLEWPSQSPDLNPIEHLWRDLKMAVHGQSPSNLTEIERICKEEW